MGLFSLGRMQVSGYFRSQTKCIQCDSSLSAPRWKHYQLRFTPFLKPPSLFSLCAPRTRWISLPTRCSSSASMTTTRSGSWSATRWVCSVDGVLTPSWRLVNNVHLRRNDGEVLTTCDTRHLHTELFPSQLTQVCVSLHPKERFQVKNPPSAYLEKLRSYLDHGLSRKVEHRVHNGRPPSQFHPTRSERPTDHLRD